MKALFWKEWRENLKWALLAAACVAGALFYGLRSDPERMGMGYGDNLWQGLLSPQALLVSSFGFPLIGAALGFLQILTELRRDQWAFLVHRPITRSQVFWGKALPGLLLYVIATVVPYLIVAWWASLPGSLPAPFDWRMTQAGLMDSLTGSGFYFAALWTGISQGKWYGRRLLPLIAACYGAVLSKGYQPLDMSLQIAALTFFALIPAAWAAFQTFGIFKRQKWFSKSCTVLALLLAVAMLHSWLLAGWHLAFPRKPHVYTDYRISARGELVRVSQEGPWIKKVVTQDGRQLQPAEGKQSFDWEDFLQPSSVILSRREERYPQAYRQVDRYFQQVHANTPEAAWYFLFRNSQFVAYERRSKLLRGYLGPQGFAARGEAENAGSFPVDGLQGRYQNFSGVFLSSEALYRPRLSRNEVQEIYRPPAGEILLGGTLFYERMMDQEKPGDFVTATDKSLQMHNADGTAILSFPQPENLERFSHVSVSRLTDRSRYFLLYQPDYRWENKQWPVYFELMPDGTVLERQDLPKQPDSRIKLSWDGVKDAMQTPFGQTLWEQVIYAVRCAIGPDTYTPIWKTTLSYRNYTLSVWGISLATGLLCAAMCFPLVRRIASSPRDRLAWLLFLLLYGVAGVIVFLIVNDWPRRLPCPACRKIRSIESSNCQACGEPWPAPERDGTEIFETEAKTI